MASWYYQVMGREVGPIATADLKQKAAAGIIQADTLIRRADSDKWYPAAQANGLFDNGSPQTPPDASTTTPSAPEPFSFPERVSVVIKGVDIGIMELATLQFRMAVAAIPAAIMLFAVGLLLMFVLGLIGGALGLLGQTINDAAGNPPI